MARDNPRDEIARAHRAADCGGRRHAYMAWATHRSLHRALLAEAYDRAGETTRREHDELRSSIVQARSMDRTRFFIAQSLQRLGEL